MFDSHLSKILTFAYNELETLLNKHRTTKQTSKFNLHEFNNAE